MSFFGKKFKKVKTDNMVEIISQLKVGEKVINLLRQGEALTSFVDNGDGTLQYQVTVDGVTAFEEKLILDKEVDFTSPDGTPLKTHWTHNGETLKNTLTFPDGKLITLTRQFSGNSMKMEVVVSGSDLKGSVEYEAV